MATAAEDDEPLNSAAVERARDVFLSAVAGTVAVANAQLSEDPTIPEDERLLGFLLAQVEASVAAIMQLSDDPAERVQLIDIAARRMRRVLRKQEEKAVV